MLISHIVSNSISIGTLQFMLAIVYGKCSYSKTEEFVLKISTSDLNDFINDSGKEALEGLLDYIELPCDIEKCISVYNFITMIEKKPVLSRERLKRDLIKLLGDCPSDKLYCAFMETSYCRQQMIDNVISKKMKSRFGSCVVTTSMLNCIYNDFREWVLKYSAHQFVFTDAQGAVGFGVNAFNTQYSLTPGVLAAYINESNQDRVIGGEGESTLLDIQPAEFKAINNASINFQDCVTKIAKASNLLYAHKNDISGAYSDIFTRYNRHTVNSIMLNVRAQYSNQTYFKLINDWGELETSLTHIRDKKTSRDLIADTMSILVTNSIPLEEVNKLYNKVRLVEDPKAFSLTNELIKPKDGVFLFGGKTRSVKSVIKNSDKFQILFEGYNALREFIQYLGDRDINPLTISPIIFRNLRFPRRFYSLDEYLRMGDAVYELYKKTLNDKGDNELKTNDEIYDMICIGFVTGTNPLVKFLTETCTLKDLHKAAEKKVLQKNETSLFELVSKTYDSYKDMLEPFYIMRSTVYNAESCHIIYQYAPIFTNEQFKKACTLEQNSKESMQKLYQIMRQSNARELLKSMLRKTTTLGFEVIPYHYCEENYINFINETSISTRTREQRIAAANNHVLSPIEKRLVIMGGIAERQLSMLREDLEALYKIIKSCEKEKNLKASESYNKYLFAYMNTLLKVVELEGQPFVKGIYMCLSVCEWENLFSYLLEDSSVVGADTKRKHRIEILRIIEMAWCKRHNPDAVLALRNLMFLNRLLQVYSIKSTLALGNIAKVKKRIHTHQEAHLLKNSSVRSTYTSFYYDGDFGLVIRAGTQKSFLNSMQQIGVPSDISLDFLQDLYIVPKQHFDTSEDELNFIKDYECLLVDTVNDFIDKHGNMVECFNTLSRKVNKQLMKPVSHTCEVFSADISNTLEIQADSLRATIASDKNSDFRELLKYKLQYAVANNEFGYVMQFNQYYKIHTGEPGILKFLHNSGYWVVVNTNDSNGNLYSTRIEEVTPNDYNFLIRGVLNEISD